MPEFFCLRARGNGFEAESLDNLQIFLVARRCILWVAGLNRLRVASTKYDRQWKSEGR
jgi:hypothetical protein